MNLGGNMDNVLYLIHYRTKDLQSGLRIFPSTVRQYFVTNYPHPLLHNHRSDGKSIYKGRGASFQFKVINNEVFILALNEGVEFAYSFQWPLKIIIPLGRNGQVAKLELASKIETQASFRETEMWCYRNLSPYIALNQTKYLSFRKIVL